MTENNRCKRIAELLLIENEVKNLEQNSVSLRLLDTIKDSLEEYNGVLSPIELVMISILLRVSSEISRAYSNHYNLVFVPQYKIGHYRVDFLVAFEEEELAKNIVIECDGHDFHEKTKEKVEYDKKRERFLTSKGYKILRYSGSEIYNNFESIEKELLSLLDPTMPNNIV